MECSLNSNAQGNIEEHLQDFVLSENVVKCRESLELGENPNFVYPGGWYILIFLLFRFSNLFLC